MSIKNAIRRAYEYNKKVGRKSIYVATDIHDTLAESNYSDEMPEVIFTAQQAVKRLAEFPEIVLILYSCSYNHEEYINYFKLHGMPFKYFNENPEVADTRTGDFSKKFYYNVMIDDKAGFEVTDWLDVVEAVEQYRVGFIDTPPKSHIETTIHSDDYNQYFVAYGFDESDSCGTVRHGPFMNRDVAEATRDSRMATNIRRVHNYEEFELEKAKCMIGYTGLYSDDEHALKSKDCGESILSERPELADQEFELAIFSPVNEIKIIL